jgi:hypothetical protein
MRREHNALFTVALIDTSLSPPTQKTCDEKEADEI